MTPFHLLWGLEAGLKMTAIYYVWGWMDPGCLAGRLKGTVLFRLECKTSEVSSNGKSGIPLTTAQAEWFCDSKRHKLNKTEYFQSKSTHIYIY